MALLTDLQWRYATKKMNGQAIPEEKLNYILEAARLAPSSSGLQPYKIFVISDKQKLAEIRKIAFDQSQITDCSHLLVWAAWDHFDEKKITDVLTETAKFRGTPVEKMIEYKDMLMSMYGHMDQQWQHDRCAKQAYISFGMAIAAAAEQKVDATPMEGFDNDKMDEYLGLREQGLRSTVILPLGYRAAEEDWLVNFPKFRIKKEEFIKEL